MGAACYGHTNCVVALIEGKADVNAKDKVRVGLGGCMVVCVCRG